MIQRNLTTSYGNDGVGQGGFGSAESEEMNDEWAKFMSGICSVGARLCHKWLRKSSITNSNPGLRLEFEILSIESLYKKHKNILTVPHRADFYHVLLVRKGKGHHLIDFRPVNLSSNSKFIYPCSRKNSPVRDGILVENKTAANTKVL